MGMATPSKHIVDSPTRDSDLVHASLLVISNARPSLLRPGIEKPIDFFVKIRETGPDLFYRFLINWPLKFDFFLKNKIKFSKKTKVDFKICFVKTEFKTSN
jgi:hypothetical protein